MSSSFLLQLKQVRVSFGQKHILDNFNLTIEPGNFLVIAGENGSGKTTLLRLLAGLISPTSGSIYRIKKLRIGYLPQYRHTDRRFPMTTKDVILSGLHNRKQLWKPFCQEDDNRIAQLLNEFQLEELSNRSIDTLSGGQWQRVLLARTFASDPQLLLMDEPDTHLDAANRHFLYHHLTNLPAKTAAVIVSHDPDFLSQYPLLYLEKGEH